MGWPSHFANGWGDRGVGLGEEHVEGLRVRIQAGFDHVLAIIGALAKYAARRRDGREQLDRVQANRGSLAGRSAPVVLAAFDQRGGGWVIAGQRRDAGGLGDAPARTGIRTE